MRACEQLLKLQFLCSGSLRSFGERTGMQRATKNIVIFTGIVIAYVAMAWLSVRLAGTYNDIAGLWAPNVILFAVLLRKPEWQGPTALVALFAGSVTGNLLKGTALEPSVVFGLIAPIYVGSLIRATQWLDRGDKGAWQLRAVTVSVIGVTGAVALGFGLTTKLLFGWSGLQAAAQLFFANLVGGALFLPFAINVTRDRLRRLTVPDVATRLWLWGPLCVGTMVASQAYSEYAFAFSMLPMIMAAIRLPPLPMSIVCMATGLAGIFVAVSGNVHNLSESHTAITAAYQFAVCVNVLMPYFVCVLIGQIMSTRRRLGESEERFRRAVDEAAVGIFTVEVDGRIVQSNPAFAGMLGYERDEVEGRYIQDFSLPEEIAAGSEIRAGANRGDYEQISFQKRYRRKDGSTFWVEVSASSIRDRVTGAVVMVSQAQDIDARKKAEQELAEMRDRWDFALASAGQGFWDFNLDAGKLTYSTTWTSMLGYRPGEMDGNEALWLSLIHPDDRKSVEQMDRDHQAGVLASFEQEYRMRHKQGHWMWVMDRGKVIERDETGKVRRMIGTLTDISERKATEENLESTAHMLAQEKERLRVTLESIGDAVICTNAEGRISFMNPVAERLTGIYATEGVGRPLESVYRTGTDGPAASASARGDGSAAWHGSVLERRDGAKLAIREVRSPILATDQSVEGNVIVFQDFTEMRRLQRELEHAAVHDDLTGLMNRLGFLDTLESLRRRSLFDGSQHQILYIDLDRFKHVNDTAGHAAGDAILKLVAGAIRDSVRSGDLVARLGGDEFGVILPSCPQSVARLAAYAVVERIVALELTWQGKAFKIGASVGAATLDKASASIDDVIADADAACYAAKSQGGASVAIAKPKPNLRSRGARAKA